MLVVILTMVRLDDSLDIKMVPKGAPIHGKLFMSTKVFLTYANLSADEFRITLVTYDRH